MQRIVGKALLCGGLFLSACANDYIYRPTENATAQIGNHTAARYEVPPERPQGDVRIASFGVARIKPTGNQVDNGERPFQQSLDESGQLRAMHVRMIVANNSAAPWYVDPREQIAIFSVNGDRRGVRESPAYAKSDVGGMPQVMVPAGGQRTLDLFYVMPTNAQKEKRIPEFDVLWQVRTGERVVAERTPFERLRVEPYYAGPGFGAAQYGWGPYGWYDPFWGPAYVGPPGWYW